jgi:hypothetical protein
VSGRQSGKREVALVIVESSGFYVVRVEIESASVERWVPIFADTILRMPPSKQ